MTVVMMTVVAECVRWLHSSSLSLSGRFLRRYEVLRVHGKNSTSVNLNSARGVANHSNAQQLRSPTGEEYRKTRQTKQHVGEGEMKESGLSAYEQNASYGRNERVWEDDLHASEV